MLLSADAVHINGDERVIGVLWCLRLNSSRSRGSRFHLTDELVHLGVSGGKKRLLTDQGILDLADQVKPLFSGTRCEVPK